MNSEMSKEKENMPTQLTEILIVEDDDVLREVMEILLTIDELHVRSARTGSEALKLIDECVPSVLVTDVLLPDMTGLEVIEKLRKKEETRDIAVIVHTSLDLSLEQQSQFKLGPTRCITKTTAMSDSLAELILELVKEQKCAQNASANG